MVFLLDRTARAEARPSMADQEERGGRSSPRTMTRAGGRAPYDVTRVKTIIPSIRIVATRMAHAVPSIGTPAAGHSGHAPTAMPIPIEMMRRISRSTRPTIASFLATTHTVAPVDRWISR